MMQVRLHVRMPSVSSHDGMNNAARLLDRYFVRKDVFDSPDNVLHLD